MNEYIMDIYFESLFDESVDINEMTEITKFVTEAFNNPIRTFKEKIRKISDSRVDDLSEIDEIKEFVDKNYNILMDGADILDKEPENLKKREVRTLMVTVFSVLSFFITGYGGAALSAINPGIGTISVIGGFITLGIGLVYSAIDQIIRYMRQTDDDTVYSDIKKVYAMVRRILSNKKLDDYTRKRLIRLHDRLQDTINNYYGAGEKNSTHMNLNHNGTTYYYNY